MEKRNPLNIMRRSEPQASVPEPPLYGPKTLQEQFPASPASVRPMVKFLREDVTVNDMLSDRTFQTHVDSILEQQYPYDARVYTTFPRVRLEKHGEVGSRRHFRDKTFMLADDDNHLYFFDRSSSKNLINADDINPSVDDSPFTLPLERAPIAGGRIEYYNVDSQSWRKSNTDTRSNIAEPIEDSFIRHGLRVLKKDNTKLMRKGEKAEAKRARREARQEERKKRDLERRTFNLDVGGQQIDIVTEEQPAYVLLSEFLDRFRSRVISIEPYFTYNPKQFRALQDKTPENIDEQGVIVEDITAALPDIVPEDEKIIQPSAVYLGCYTGLGNPSVDFRFIAIPARPSNQTDQSTKIPLDTALSVSARNQGASDFTVSSKVYDVNTIAAKLTVHDKDKLPIEDGLYLIINHQEERKPSEDPPPKDVRIVGVREGNQIFHTDVDVTGPGPKLLP